MKVVVTQDNIFLPLLRRVLGELRSVRSADRPEVDEQVEIAIELRRQSNQQIITLNSTSTLGHGGEARVYALPQDETLVAKVYHQTTDTQAPKLLAMLANPPENPTTGQGHISIAWPTDLLSTIDGSDKVAGFLMPRVQGMYTIVEFYNPKTRRQNCPFFTYRYLHRTARNLAAAVGALHARGYCIGDVNESNILVGDTALVTLVDTDSFQVRDPHSGDIYRCRVGKPEFTPPELQGKSFKSVDRTVEHDLFGLGVLIFQLLMEGTHPFSGIFQGIGDPPPYFERIAAGHFPYSTTRRGPYMAMPTAPPWEILHPTLRQLFVRCFEDGHSHPQMRPSAQDWQAALKEAENALVICSANNQHQYGNHLNSCPWCERARALGGRDPFPSRQAVQQKQHLQPFKPKRLTLPTANHVSPTLTQRAYLPSRGLFAIIPVKKKKKRLGPLALGFFGVSFGGFLAFLFIVKDLNLVNESNATLLPRASDTTRSKAKTNSDRGYVDSYNQGNIYYKIGDYRGAIANFSQALRLNPKDAKAYLSRGNAQYQIGQSSGYSDYNYKEAIKDFNQALRLKPDDAEAYLRRGIVRCEIAKYSKNPVKDYQAAIGDFNQALRLNPHQDEAYLKRGLVHYEIAKYSKKPNLDYKAAVEDVNQALRLNPNEAEAYYQRGLVRYRMAQFKGGSNWEAVADLQKAAKFFLEKGNIDRYQQALGNICVALENECESSLLQNPEKFIFSGSQSKGGYGKQGK